MTPNTKATADQSHAGALLPCPFCGGRAVMRNDDDPGYPFYITFDHDDDCVMYAVPTDLFRSFATETEAVAVWNRRTASHAGATDEQVERVAAAMEAAEFRYRMELTRLVDGVSTYTLTYDDASEPLTFETTDECYEHVAKRKRETQARAALAAMPTPEPTPKGSYQVPVIGMEFMSEAASAPKGDRGYWGPDVDGDYIVTALGPDLSFAVPDEDKARRIVAALSPGPAAASEAVAEEKP